MNIHRFLLLSVICKASFDFSFKDVFIHFFIILASAYENVAKYLSLECHLKCNKISSPFLIMSLIEKAAKHLFFIMSLDNKMSDVNVYT